jgi:tRNA/rRNA methyltransferase
LANETLTEEFRGGAGTDRRRALLSGGPAIILVAPQLGENIGTAARAMLNCGLDDLRLVAPREGWPSDKAVRAASGADSVLEKARLYPSVAAAIGGLVHVYAASARERAMVKRVVGPRLAAFAAGEPSGVLFGPERTGLLNDEMALAETILKVPLNPGFSSLNLAQAVLIVGYEWFLAGSGPAPEALRTGKSCLATKAELFAFFEHLEEALQTSGFYTNPERRPSTNRNLRNLFQRARPTDQELRTLHGLVTAFAGPRKRKRKREGD